MTSKIDYSPRPLFSLADTGRETPPVGLISPARYVQGPDLLDHLGRFLSIVPSTRPVVYISPGGLRRHGDQLLDGLRAMQIAAAVEIFGGECSHSEIERAAASLQAQNTPFDSLIAVGGGKCLDAGKCVAESLAIPVVICPTIASTDAPCSALSVIYTDEGIVHGGQSFPDSPALVLVDSQLIAAAPVRYLVAGMGDALATRYEARTCYRNPRRPRRHRQPTHYRRPGHRRTVRPDRLRRWHSRRRSQLSRRGRPRARAGDRSQYAAERHRLRERGRYRRPRRCHGLHPPARRTRKLPARRDGGDGPAHPTGAGAVHRRVRPGRPLLR